MSESLESALTAFLWLQVIGILLALILIPILLIWIFMEYRKSEREYRDAKGRANEYAKKSMRESIKRIKGYDD